MGIAALEQFSSMAHFVPLYLQDQQLTNQVFLIKHDPTGPKDAHTSVLVDVAGTSTATNIKGVLCHVVANTNDGQIPHSTSFKCDYWESPKSRLTLIYVGNLAESKYIGGVEPLPQYLNNPWMQNGIHQHLINPQIAVAYKQSLLHFLTSYLYSHMAELYEQKWSASLNCQQFARRFIEETIGLNWPDGVSVAGDIVNEIPEVNMNIKQPMTVIVMCITIVATIKALALDYRNDVLFNCIALISGLLVHIRHLTGVMADPDFLKLITRIAINFSPHLTKIVVVKAFHFRTNLLVEVDIGLLVNMQIQQAHDIDINLQMKL
ncbi:unnamed protein product [Rotaria sp. Silwood1]|nr:unnamed protein product [Rotaria sp. Silwood1]CAF1637763.1 unnamed protein product [Rotaria sp. Silwood1]CAF3830584.1 unnamed protein product [Rotaria sp. Silwood1]CAF5008165.1 unnamed protein product [Rotaria sp. Silwood1]